MKPWSSSVGAGGSQMVCGICAIVYRCFWTDKMSLHWSANHFAKEDSESIPGAMHPPTASSVQGYFQVSSTDQTCNGYHYKSCELPEPKESSYAKSWWTATWDFKADSVAYTTVWLATPCVMLGRFHLEMGALCWPCKWLTGKGWTASIVHSQLYT